MMCLRKNLFVKIASLLVLASICVLQPASVLAEEAPPPASVSSGEVSSGSISSGFGSSMSASTSVATAPSSVSEIGPSSMRESGPSEVDSSSAVASLPASLVAAPPPAAEGLAGIVTDFDDLLDNVKTEYGKNSSSATALPGTLEKDSALWVTYYLKDIQLGDVANLSSSPYIVNTPQFLQKATSVLGSLNVMADDVGRVGTLTFDASGATFTFDIANLTSIGGDKFPLEQLHFAFEARLDMGEVGGRQTIHLGTEKNTTVVVNIQDNQPKDAEITNKTGSYNEATGAIDWTVTLGRETALFVPNDPVDPNDPDAGALVYTPYLFEDELGNDQYYWPGSFTINGAAPSAAAGLSYDAASHRLSCTMVGGLPAETTLKYSTLPEKSLLYTYDAGTGQYSMKTPTANGLPVQNKALLKKAAGQPPLSQKSTTGNFAVKNWIKKRGVSTDFASRTITWELQLNTNGCSFTDISVYDHLPANLSYTGTADLQVTAADGGPVNYTANTGFTGQGTAGDDAAAQQLLTISSPAPTVYTIQYKTGFPSAILGTGSINYQNQAWLRYTWPVGPGDSPVTLGVPTVGGNHQVNSAYIAKTATYNAETHRINWAMEINRNRNAVGNLVVNDWIDYNNTTAREEDKQTFVAGSLQLTEVNGGAPSGASVQLVPDALNPKKFSLTFTGLAPTDSAKVTYQTEATDPSFYANNAKETFHNQAVILDGANTLQTVNANPQFTSTVLEKSAKGYQYNSHAIGWEIQVNKNKLAYLPQVVVTEALPPHLQLDETSLRLDGAPMGTSPATGNYYTLQPEAGGGQRLRIFLQDDTDPATTPATPFVNRAHTLHYNTILDVNATPDFSFVQNNNENYTAVNTAQLDSELCGPVEVRAEQSIPNQSFAKTSQLDRAGLGVQYTIAINQAMADMGSAPLVVKDTLPQGVLLDIESVELWPAKVNSSGKLEKEGVAPQSGTTLQVEGNQMRLSLNLSTTTQRNRAWLLFYRVDLVEGAGSYNLTNHASMGLTSSSLGSEDNLHFTISATEAGGAHNTRRNLKLTRVDENTKEPLPGAVFGLYAYYPGTNNRYLVGTATTDTNGNLTFKGLKLGRMYEVEELTPPAGYPAVPKQTFTVQLGTAGSAMEIFVESAQPPPVSSSPAPSVPSSSPPPSSSPSPSSSASSPSSSSIEAPSPSGTSPTSGPKTAPPTTSTESTRSPQTSDAHSIPWGMLLLFCSSLACTLLVLRAVWGRKDAGGGKNT